MLAHQIPVILGGSVDPSVIFAEMPGAWLEPRIGQMWQENTGTTPTTAAGQSIGKINDLSGYGYNATQSTVANRPTLQYTNGLPIVGCDSNDFMTVGLSEINVRRNLFPNSIWSGAVVGTPGTPPTNWDLIFNTGTLQAITPTDNNGYSLKIQCTSARWVIRSAVAVSANTAYTASATIVENSGLAIIDIFGIPVAPAGSTFTYAINNVPALITAVPVAGDRISIIMTTAGTTGNVSFRYGCGANSNVTGSVTLSNPQMELGSVAMAYQRITDWTSEQFSSFGSVYFALPTGMSALHNQSIGTSYSAPIQSMDLYGALIVPSRLSDQREAQLQVYFKKLAGLR